MVFRYIIHENGHIYSSDGKRGNIMINICNKAKFTIAAALITTVLSVGCPAAARYDELIIPDRLNRFIEATGSDISNEMYVVKSGDSLWELSARYGLTVEELRYLNGLEREKNLIVTGQRLRVSTEKPVTHMVKRGENLWVIASSYNVEVSDLVEKNRISDADYLLEGEKLVVLPNRSGTAKNKQVAQATQQVSRNLATGDFVWPVQGFVSSGFGIRDGRQHQGVDIAAAEGTTIRVTKKGRVVFAGPRGTYGLAVIIEHSGEMQTLYAHCSKLLVSADEDVTAGQAIAEVGNTGRSNGPHLHFEIIRQGVHCDPLPFFKDNYS